MPKTLADISEAMRDIDFCTLATHSGDGSIGGRPMSNNRNVDYAGDSWFFTYDDRLMVRDIERDPNVGLSYLGSAGLMGIVGKPGLFIHVEGRASLVRDQARFAEHWDKSLDRWFPQGPSTPGLVMIQVTARRVHYWDGEEEGEVALHGATADPPATVTGARIVGRADDGEGVEAMVVAIGGSTLRPDGGTWHVTWSLAEGRAAKESNDVIARSRWKQLDGGELRLEPARW